jgi:hypothetical protein
MDEEKKDNKVLEFPKNNGIPLSETFINTDDEPEIKASQYFELPEDFIYTEDNLNLALTMIGIYKMAGLNDEMAVRANCMFVDVFGDLIGLVPERPLDDEDD